MKHSLDCRLSPVRSRRGSLIVESVVAIALLATAFIALGNLAASSAAIGQNADQRLAATLAAENVLEQLQDISFDTVVEDAPRIGKSVQDACNYDVQIQTNEFRAGDRDAIHVTVTVRPSTNHSITLHDWRISESTSSSLQKEEGDE